MMLDNAVNDGSAQLVFNSQLHPIFNVGDQQSFTQIGRDVIVGILAGFLVLDKIIRVLHFADVVIVAHHFAEQRIRADFFGGDQADDPALDPARSSAVVAWLQSADSAWLTGQILRVNGHVLSRVDGFREAAERYHAKDGVALQFSELGQAASWLYGTSPRGLAGPLPSR